MVGIVQNQRMGAGITWGFRGIANQVDCRQPRVDWEWFGV